MIRSIRETRRALKSLKAAPELIRINYLVWRGQVTTSGLEEVRKVPGYHDEPLQGKLRGVRSVRLGRSYRVFYRLVGIDTIETVIVEDVNRHDYKEIERLLGR
jgi:toxin HigB-1